MTRAALFFVLSFAFYLFTFAFCEAAYLFTFAFFQFTNTLSLSSA